MSTSLDNHGGLGDHGGYFHMVIPPDLARLTDVRALMVQVGEAGGLDGERVFDLQVVVSEASANAIEHASSWVNVDAWVLFDRVLVEVCNDGVFRPGLYKDGRSRRRGLGLPLMVSLADAVHIARMTNETRVSLTFFRRPVVNALAEALQSPRSPDAAIRELEAEAMKLRLMTARAERLADAQSGLHEEGRQRVEEFETLMDVVPAAIWVTRDPECHTIIGNRTADDFYESRPGENVSAAPTDRGTYHDAGRRFFRGGEELAPHELPMQRSAAEGVDIRGEELQVLRPSGRWMTMIGNASPLRDAEGNVRGSVAAFVDITDLRRAEDPQAGQAADMQFLSAAASRLLLQTSAAEVLRFAATQVSDLAGRALVAMNEYRPETGEWFVHALVGAQRKIDEAVRVLGREPAGLTVPIREEPSLRLHKEGLHRVEGGLSRLLAGEFDVATLTSLERQAELGEAYLMSLTSGSTILGSMVLFTDRMEGLRNRATIEAFVHQVALALGRAQTAEVLADSEERQRQACARVERDKILLLGIARILVEALSERGEADLRRVCAEVAREVTDSAVGLVAGLEDDGGAHSKEASAGDAAWDAADLLTQDDTDAGQDRPLDCSLGVPLLRDGHVQGMIAVGDRLGGYDEEQRELLETLAPVVVEAFARKRAEEALRQSAERHRLLAEENARLYREQLTIAESLQSMLAHLPEQVGQMQLGHLYHSATESAFVGGDFYDAFSLAGNKVAVLIGDVAGHGIKAARVALLVKDVVHAFLHRSSDPAEVLTETNALLLEKSFSGFVSLFLGVLDVPSGEFDYATAGHPYGLVKKPSGQIYRFMTGSTPLAVHDDATWETGRLELQTGDVLFFYTDGLVEIRHDGEFLGEAGLAELLRRTNEPVQRLPRATVEGVLDFSGGALRDDVAILTLSFGGPALAADGSSEAVDAVAAPGTGRDDAVAVDALTGWARTAGSAT